MGQRYFISVNYWKLASKLVKIHHVKTKKITSMKEVWIPGLNKHWFWRFHFSIYSLVFVSIKKYYIKHLRQCLISYPNTLNFVKNTLLHLVCSTLFLVFGYADETLSSNVVFLDIYYSVVISRQRQFSRSIEVWIWRWNPNYSSHFLQPIINWLKRQLISLPSVKLTDLAAQLSVKRIISRLTVTVLTNS